MENDKKPDLLGGMFSRFTGVGADASGNIDPAEAQTNSTSFFHDIWKAVSNFLGIAIGHFTDPETAHIQRMAFLDEPYSASLPQTKKNQLAGNPDEAKPEEPKLSYAPAEEEWKPAQKSAAARATFGEAASLEGIPLARLYPEAQQPGVQPTPANVYSPAA